MEIKTGEASIKTQTSSETDSESEISLEKIVEKKKNMETQHSETIMYFHYYTEILYDKPLSLKQSCATVQEKGKKSVLHEQEMHRRDLPVSPPPVAYHATGGGGRPVAVNNTTLQATGQFGIIPYVEQRGSKVSDMTDPVTVFDTSSAVDVQPLAESVPIVGPAHDTRGQYGAFRSPVNTQSNVQHSQRNKPMRTPFSTITQRERLNALRLGDSRDDQTVRISYPFSFV